MPRQQGAGIMWFDGALHGNVVLIGDKGESMILRNKASDREELTFAEKNYSSEGKTFICSVVAVTDDVEDGRFRSGLKIGFCVIFDVTDSSLSLRLLNGYNSNNFKYMIIKCKRIDSKNHQKDFFEKDFNSKKIYRQPKGE